MIRNSFRKRTDADDDMDYLEIEMVNINGRWFHPKNVSIDQGYNNKRDSSGISARYAAYLTAHPASIAGN